MRYRQAWHDLPPRVPALWKPRQKNHGLAAWPASPNVMQPDAFNGCKVMRKTMWYRMKAE
jgi:hypothetical protein